MKKLLSLLMCGLLLFGCSDEYDDSALRNDLNDLENRVSKLEELCKQMNTNISSLQTIVTALQKHDYVTGITPVVQDGKEVGYTITFSKSNPITIYHGKDGQNGENGTNGKDGATPAIGVKQDTDGIYYWTLNGDWLTDEHGDKIKAEGTDGVDGSDGEDGSDGTNGITPQFKIENNYWFISYDNGNTWARLGKATGEDGKNGEDGADGDSMFTNVDYKTSTDYVIFTLADGSQIKLPTWSAFEALQRLCNETNTNLSALQTIVTALQNNDYITSVDPLTENGKVVGYTIKFAKSNPIVIYNGKNGADGVDGNTPVIGVKKDTDDIYYWTLDGEFIVVDGQKIKAQGTDGSDGSNGANGVIPKLEIREGYWYVSYDNGANWAQLGKATGEDGKDGDSIKITQDENNVYFELVDGTAITISKKGQSSPNIIEFKDPYVKTICVAAWDTDGDSELSYAEATAVTTLGTRFSGNTLIESFDELQYFTHLTTIEERAFEKCTSLTSIIIPASVETIGKQAFSNCSSLCIVDFAKASILKTIGGDTANGAFYNCTALESIKLPASVEVIESSAFQDCTALRNLSFVDGSRLKIIGGGGRAGAFANCSSLTTVEIPANVEIIAAGAFMYCTALTSVEFQQGSKLTEIGGGHLNQCYGAFAECENLTTFDASLCTQIEKIGDGAFFNDTKLGVFKIGTPTPPEVADHAFGYNEYRILGEILSVPVGCSEDYKSWGFKNIVEIE